MTPLDLVPLWAFFLIIVVVSMVVLEVGRRLGGARVKKEADHDRAPIGSAVGAMLGLFAFLLAFIFSFAANRFDERRSLVVGEANIIGTTYLRSEFLASPEQEEVKQLLRDYLDVRLSAAEGNPLEEALVASGRIHDRLWSIAARAGLAHPDSQVVSLFIQSVNELIDEHSLRLVGAIKIRIPSVIWGALALVTILSLAALGYQAGLSESHNIFAQTTLVLAFATVITLIADLDRPREGFLKVSQEPIIELRNKVGTSPSNATHLK